MSESRPTKRTEKLQLMLNDEELRVIEDWRFSNRMPTRSAAVRELMRRGLQAEDTAIARKNGSTRAYGVVEGPLAPASDVEAHLDTLAPVQTPGICPDGPIGRGQKGVRQ
ncbi:MAG: hypothetical protein Kilf2KO_15180 [Rhodospirillales bacterium]